MKSGYKIEWTNHAKEELEATIDYLEENFTEKELRKLFSELERVLHLISQNPKLFAESPKTRVRKVNIRKYNSLYYRIKEDAVEILSFFSNRQHPDRIKIS